MLHRPENFEYLFTPLASLQWRLAVSSLHFSGSLQSPVNKNALKYSVSKSVSSLQSPRNLEPTQLFNIKLPEGCLQVFNFQTCFSDSGRKWLFPHQKSHCSSKLPTLSVLRKVNQNRLFYKALKMFPLFILYWYLQLNRLQLPTRASKLLRTWNRYGAGWCCVI